MTALRVLLVDDEPLALARLRGLVAETSGAQVVGEAGTGAEALDIVGTLKPDIVLLDIEMPGMDGMAVARALGAAGGPEVIFATAFDRYASAAFEVDATDYLLKPVKPERLRLALERARRRRELRRAGQQVLELELALAAARGRPRSPTSSYESELWVPKRDGLFRVPVAVIEWIEAARDYVLLHTSMRSHIYRTTMAALERRLDPADLMRVHRSAFVRLGSVIGVQQASPGQMAVSLVDGTVIPVGPTYAEGVLQALNIAGGEQPSASDVRNLGATPLR